MTSRPIIAASTDGPVSAAMPVAKELWRNLDIRLAAKLADLPRSIRCSVTTDAAVTLAPQLRGELVAEPARRGLTSVSNSRQRRKGLRLAKHNP